MYYQDSTVTIVDENSLYFHRNGIVSDVTAVGDKHEDWVYEVRIFNMEDGGSCPVITVKPSQIAPTDEIVFKDTVITIRAWFSSFSVYTDFCKSIALLFQPDYHQYYGKEHPYKKFDGRTIFTFSMYSLVEFYRVTEQLHEYALMTEMMGPNRWFKLS